MTVKYHCELFGLYKTCKISSNSKRPGKDFLAIENLKNVLRLEYNTWYWSIDYRRPERCLVAMKSLKMCERAEMGPLTIEDPKTKIPAKKDQEKFFWL